MAGLELPLVVELRFVFPFFFTINAVHANGTRSKAISTKWENSRQTGRGNSPGFDVLLYDTCVKF